MAGYYGYSDGGGRRQQRGRGERIPLSQHQALSEIPDFCPAGGTYFFGQHRGFGVMVVIKAVPKEKPEDKDDTEVWVVECGPVTAQPLGDPLVLESGFPGMAGFPVGMPPGIPVGPGLPGGTPSSVWSGGGWVFTYSPLGAELVRNEGAF